MITRIELSGYRLLDQFTADLRRLTVVIGANATGKSTLLDALQFIAQCADVPLLTAANWHWGFTSLLNASRQNQSVGWKIVFKKPDIALWKTLPMDANQPLCYNVALQGNMQGQINAQYEVLQNLEPFGDHPDPLKHLEVTPNRRQIYSRTQRRLVAFDDAVSQPDHMVPATEMQVREAAEDQDKTLELPVSAREPALMLSQIRFLNEFPVPSAARMLLASMAFYTGFDVSRYSNLRLKASEIKPVTLLTTNGENLGMVLHEILTRYDYRSAAGDLRDFLKAAYPAFDDIHCDTTYSAPPQVMVRVREKGMRRSMELFELSDGMLRFLCLAVALLNPVPPPFVAIDEPEIGLHPRLLPIIADMVKTASERTQVLITTHSPELLNHFDLNDIAVMTRRDDETANAIWKRPNDRPSLVQMLAPVTGETLGDLHRSGELEALA